MSERRTEPSDTVMGLDSEKLQRHLTEAEHAMDRLRRFGQHMQRTGLPLNRTLSVTT